MLPVITEQQLIILKNYGNWAVYDEDDGDPFQSVQMSTHIPGLGELRIFENGDIFIGEETWMSDRDREFVSKIFYEIREKINKNFVSAKEEMLSDFIAQCAADIAGH